MKISCFLISLFIPLNKPKGLIFSIFESFNKFISSIGFDFQFFVKSFKLLSSKIFLFINKVVIPINEKNKSIKRKKTKLQNYCAIHL